MSGQEHIMESGDLLFDGNILLNQSTIYIISI
jgi:hypothetical protein